MDPVLVLPLGFQFAPSDIQLIDHYLRKRKLAGAPIKELPEYLVKECAVYENEPWKLQCDKFRYQDEEKNMHFFTHRRPTTKSSSRADRNAGRGYWHQSGKDNHIKKGSVIIGHKTQLNFIMKKGERKTNWIMHEYRLDSPSTSSPKMFDDLVLCRIHKTKGRKCEEEEIDTGPSSADVVTSAFEKEGKGSAGRSPAKRRRVEGHDLVTDSGQKEEVEREGRSLMKKRRQIKEPEMIVQQSMPSSSSSGVCYYAYSSASVVSSSGVAASTDYSGYCVAPAVVEKEARFDKGGQIGETEVMSQPLTSASPGTFYDYESCSSASSHPECHDLPLSFSGSIIPLTEVDAADNDALMQELLDMIDFSGPQTLEDVSIMSID